jgi:hypothetical protein
MRTRSVILALILTISFLAPAHASAGPDPKLLFFGGIDLRKGPIQVDDKEARYYGSIGIDGFFLSYLMSTWSTSVGDDENGASYQLARRFQHVFGAHGVDTNFLTVAMGWQGYLPFDPRTWSDPTVQARIVSNFRQAAHLVRYAGLRGIAFDLEPYTRGIWAPQEADSNKPREITLMGKRIAEAINSECPGCDVIVFPEVIVFAANPAVPAGKRYQLSPHFWNGLVTGGLRRLVVGTERTFTYKDPLLIVRQTERAYQAEASVAQLPVTAFPIAIGLWPLGFTYTNKAAHEPPDRFKGRLQAAYRSGQPYVWIYGHGSAWEANGPYGEGALDPRFKEFVEAIHRTKAATPSPHH